MRRVVRPDRVDAIVIGAGAVGAVAALALRQRGLTVRVVDAGSATAAPDEAIDARVFAVSPASAGLLRDLGVWSAIAPRATAYDRMVVWDAASGSDITFDAVSLGLPALGHIIENAALVAAAQAALADVDHGVRVTAIEPAADGHTVVTDAGDRWTAQLVVVADGPASPCRQMLDIDADTHDYRGRAIVCHARTAESHASTAWQRFLPTGPVALLPLVDGRVSVVWSADDALAGELLAADDTGFAEALTEATGARLGDIQHVTTRYAFPLRRLTARAFTAGRCVLVGDAAHVVHPLAGQGVNLGLDDVRALTGAVDAALAQGPRLPGPVALRRAMRARQADVARMSLGIDAIQRLFASRHPVVASVRGLGLHAVDVAQPAKHVFAEVALGVKPGFGGGFSALAGR